MNYFKPKNYNFKDNDNDNDRSDEKTSPVPTKSCYRRRRIFHLSIVRFCFDYHSRNGTFVFHNIRRTRRVKGKNAT